VDALLLLLEPVRRITGRVCVVVVAVDERRLDYGLVLPVVENHRRGRRVIAGIRHRRGRCRRSRLVLMVAAREYGRCQQPPYAFLFSVATTATATVRRFNRRRRHRRSHPRHRFTYGLFYTFHRYRPLNFI